jgi:hypothetical protein
MPEFLKSVGSAGEAVSPLDLAVRLLAALLFGGAVAWIYRCTRKSPELAAPSFLTTLVLLAVLIAMVTQVIGDNVARAFSLVGALSIVRFRTVVRDTEDTAYVIFAVVVGMAVGAKDPWVAVIGIAVVGAAAFIMMLRVRAAKPEDSPFELALRVGLGHDLNELLGPTLDAHVAERELVSVATTKQGVALEVIYRTRLKKAASPDALLKALHRLEGVQSVHVLRKNYEPD